MTLTVKTVTIRAGEAVSDALDLSTASDLVRMNIPEGLPAGPMTFMVSSDNNFFNDLHFSNGYEPFVTTRPGTAMSMTGIADLNNFPYLKLRSGTRGQPVPVATDCVFSIVVETPSVLSGLSLRQRRLLAA
jgi:hypothetical protein